ncbi:nucleotide exchange factor GrpE, partial [Desertihabitans aurantiacus]|uniref:nucleotide exchange factor GrpE n=1 Tax=Desertihabitans aurantiacus TaxID=2282477 RepID=UPI000DF737EE
PEAQPEPGVDPGAVAGTVDDLPAAGAAPESPEPVEGVLDGAPADDRAAQLEQALLERTQDLQRLQAEYVNYKRRVDRDRELSRGQGVESVLRELLPVLDDLRSAREHGELTGAFKAVGEAVEKVTSRQGLVVFGEVGEPFDPMVHEALMHSYSEDVTEPTCVQILQPGYRLGDRVLRPARVAVAEPSAPGAGVTDPGTTGA